MPVTAQPLSPLTQSKIPGKEWCHPQHQRHPISINTIKDNPWQACSEAHLQDPSRESVPSTINTNPPRKHPKQCKLIYHCAFDLELSCESEWLGVS